MAKPIDLNQEIVISFEIIPSQKVLHPIASLCDRSFNTNGIGRVDITEEGFEITVCDAKTQAAARLLWKSSRLINFHCTKPILGKIIQVIGIYDIVFHAVFYHHKTITILHLDGSNKLTFILGEDLDSEISVAFTEMNTEIERIPSIKIFCETVFPCLSQMIFDQLAIVKAPKIVSVSVNLPRTFVTARTPQTNWMYKNPRVNDQMAAGKNHHVWFNSHPLSVMRFALFVEGPCHIYFLTEPAKTVMIRISIPELGDIVFFCKALNSIGNHKKLSFCPEGEAIIATQPV